MRGQRAERGSSRKGAEPDAVEPIGEKPRTGDEEGELAGSERAPSFLSARELQAREPAKGERALPEERTQKPPSKNERDGSRRR